jgi:5'-3' exonuclease
LGPKTIAQLFHDFKTISKMKTAGQEVVAKKIGAAKAQLLFQYFEQL